MVKCTCLLMDGPGKTVPAELHDEDCEFYLHALAAEARADELRAVREEEWG